MPKINISGSQEERICTDELIISQNVLIYEESFIPLYNISMVSVVEEPKEEYHIWACIMVGLGIVVGFWIIVQFSEWAVGIVIAFVLVAIGLFDIGMTNQRNAEAGEFLVINLNSGRNLLFYSHNHKFILKVMDVMINCINNGDECIINLENCYIEACQFGNDNIMSGRDDY